MDAIDTVRLLAELDGEHCGLNHGPDTNPEEHRACDYVVIPFGDTTKEIATTERDLVVPVCLECVQALVGEEWTLLFCFECNASRWVYRQRAKNQYRHHALWLRGCPDCSNEFGGLYFTDEENAAIDVGLVSHLNRRAA
nr:hypothetical protein [Desulfobulbaceae bacterium]